MKPQVRKRLRMIFLILAICIVVNLTISLLVYLLESLPLGE